MKGIVETFGQNIGSALTFNSPYLLSGIGLGYRLPSDMSAENQDILSEWLAEFEAAARRPLKQRWRYAFIKTYKPVMDDADFRAFDTMEEYRRWCAANLPRWLGYARV